MIYIGTAGWSIPASAANRFPGTGGHLKRYSAQLNAAEINSTFYRAHKESTFVRWTEAVPEPFRFSVKLPGEITHEQRLVDVGALLEIFLLQLTCLGDKFACLLVQLPPSLAYDARVAAQFFATLRDLYDGPVALEPRHPTWFSAATSRQLMHARVSRVVADPAVVPEAAIAGGFPNPLYLRLHGSPRVYYSPYDDAALAAAAVALRQAQIRGVDAWCIFDNTASGAAATDAHRLQELLASAVSQKS